MHVQWYLSDKMATGVENMSDDWVPHDVAPNRSIGFRNEFDPEPDLHEDPWDATGPGVG